MSEPLMNTSDNRNGQDEAIYQGNARGSTVSGANTIPGGSPVSRRSTGIPARNAFFCFMAAFIWGTAFVAQRVGGEHMGPFTMNGFRGLLAFFVLLPLVLLRKKARKEREQAGDLNLEPYSFKRTVKGGIFVGLILLAASTLQQIGIMQVDVGKAGFMTALYIIIVPVLSFFITRRGSVRVFTAAGLAAAGLYFLSFSSAEGFAPADLMLLGCAFAYSMHILCIDHFSKGTDAVELSCIQFLVSGLAGTLISLIVEKPVLSSFGMAGWLSLLYAGVFSSGAAYTFQILGQKGADPAIASLILSLESVISAVSGFVLLHQVLTGREIFGCALMFTAIVLVQLPAGRKKLQVPEEKHS